MSNVGQLVARINAEIINPLLWLIVAAALVYFLWGAAEFIRNAESDDGRSKGKRHMLWGIIGLFLILSVKGILYAVTRTFGVELP